MNDDEPRAALEGPGLIQSVGQYLFLAIAIVVLFAALGGAVAVAAPKSYSATASLVLVDLNTNSSTGPGRATAAVAEQVSSDAVLNQALKDHSDLGLTAIKLRDDCDGTAATDSPTVSVSCTASKPQDAADRANAVANALKEVLALQAAARYDTLNKNLDAQGQTDLSTLVSSKSRPAQKAVAQKDLQNIADRKLAIIDEQTRNQQGVQFTTPALVPSKSGLKSDALDGGIGALVGVIIAMITCWVLADRRRLVEDAEIPARVTGARLLGEVAVLRGPATRAITRFTDMPAPPFGFVAAGLWGSIESGMLIVSGAEHDAGTTTTTASIAAAFARDGRRVVVVDADGRGRGLSRLAGVNDGTAGLSDVLTHRAPLEDSLRAVELGDGSSVAVLAAGQPEADLASLLRTRTMSETLERLREWYDLVIIDTPPLASDPEAASLSRYADGLLLVVARNTRLRRLVRLRERLALLNVAVLGYVFNRDQHAEVTLVRTRSASRA